MLLKIAFQKKPDSNDKKILAMITQQRISIFFYNTLTSLSLFTLIG